jgi:hypothetical protein
VGDWHELAQVRANYGYEELSDGYAGKCHLCVDVRRRLASREEFAELRLREFYEAF